jgi:hypothetical protein
MVTTWNLVKSSGSGAFAVAAAVVAGVEEGALAATAAAGAGALRWSTRLPPLTAATAFWKSLSVSRIMPV